MPLSCPISPPKGWARPGIRSPNVFLRHNQAVTTTPPTFTLIIQTDYFMQILRLLLPREISIKTASKAHRFQSPFVLSKSLGNRRLYSCSMAQHGHSAACCSIPPIVSKGYEAKGKYETIGGTKTCELLFLSSSTPISCSGLQ